MKPHPDLREKDDDILLVPCIIGVWLIYICVPFHRLQAILLIRHGDVKP